MKPCFLLHSFRRKPKCQENSAGMAYCVPDMAAMLSLMKLKLPLLFWSKHVQYKVHVSYVLASLSLKDLAL